MPLYFFNIYDGMTIIDETGTDISALADIRKIAFQTALEVLGNQQRPIAREEPWKMEVVDENGEVVLRVKFEVDDQVAR